MGSSIRVVSLLVVVLIAFVAAKSRKPGCFSTCFRNAYKEGNTTVLKPCFIDCYDKVAKKLTKDDTSKMLKLIPEAKPILMKLGLLQQEVTPFNGTIVNSDAEEMSDSEIAPNAQLEATAGLNIRRSPCTNGQIITAVVAGTRMTYTNQAQTACGYTWYGVRGSFGEGWAASVYLREVTPSPGRNFPLFKQCDGRWANDRLGSSTVCSIGCLMSSVSMALNGLGRAVDGQAANPGVLNRFLSRNGGYQGNLFIWGSVSRFGFGYVGQTRDKNQIRNYVQQGKIVILNVRNGGHWVLATGLTGNGFVVNDSGFNVGSYTNGEVVLAGVYNV